MRLDLRQLMPYSRGEIIEIKNGMYGRNYEMNTVQDVQNGDLFLYRGHDCYYLVEIAGNRAHVLIRECANSLQHVIFSYIKSLRWE